MTDELYRVKALTVTMLFTACMREADSGNSTAAIDQVLECLRAFKRDLISVVQGGAMSSDELPGSDRVREMLDWTPTG